MEWRYLEKHEQWRKRLFCLLSLVLFSMQAYAADPVKGQEIFIKHCISCHEAGRAMPGAADFSMGESLFQTDDELYEKIRTGKNAMPGYFGILDDDMILDVIAYMRMM